MKLTGLGINRHISFNSKKWCYLDVVDGKNPILKIVFKPPFGFMDLEDAALIIFGAQTASCGFYADNSMHGSQFFAVAVMALLAAKYQPRLIRPIAPRFGS
tara:strand:- start:193 stop:495 length:303 start_codon:yes stop_codon:yes gene_type:complete